MTRFFESRPIVIGIASSAPIAPEMATSSSVISRPWRSLSPCRYEEVRDHIAASAETGRRRRLLPRWLAL